MKTTDSCIACRSCINECPVSAIVDDVNNPEDENRYYVYSNKCVECAGYNDQSVCASACPTDDCIVWSEAVSGQPSRESISSDMRNDDTSVST